MQERRNSFTLVELLIVMGVLAVVVVTILVTLNPSEAGKKSRDVKRMKDLATLEAIVLQWLQDGKEPFCKTGFCTSISAGQVQSQNCSDNWIRQTTDGGVKVDLCLYANSIPTDPRNAQPTTIINGGTVSQPTTRVALDDMYYAIRMNGSDYKIIVRQESKSNAANVLNDGGTYTDFAEVFSHGFQL